MAISLYDASIPLFINGLTSMAQWLDKAQDAAVPEATLIDARLAPDMRPLSAQFQMASDAAKNCAARLTGTDAPAMPDTETSFAELKDRCARTIAYLQGIDRAAVDGQEGRSVELKFPNGLAFGFDGQGYLTGFAIPNFFFHLTTAYAILRMQGVVLGKPDYLAHLAGHVVAPAA